VAGAGKIEIDLDTLRSPMQTRVVTKTDRWAPRMKALQYIGVVALAVVLLFFFVANYSSVKTSFECPGGLTNSNLTEPTTIFFRLEEYRWWVGLWSESDGNLWLEVPNISVEYYAQLVEVGDQIQIYYDGAPAGMFSTLSKSFSLDTHRGFFDGVCTQTAD